MGNNIDKSVIPKNINTQNSLIQEIHSVANELVQTYNVNFLNPKFCTTVALIYNDKLSNFRKQELNNVSMTLGLLADTPDKQKLCSLIVKHYTDRINLIAAIQSSISFCSDRIFALISGPRCEGNPEVFDQDTCQKNNGRWVEYIVPPDDTLEQNRPWYSYLYEMQTKYIEVLARMLDILKQLKNFDNDINDETLKVLGQEVEQLIQLMQRHCYNLYKLSLTTKTVTPDEILAEQNNNIIAQQEAAARNAAIRATHGLSTVSES